MAFSFNSASIWRKLGSIPYYLAELSPQLHLKEIVKSSKDGTRHLFAQATAGGPTYALPLPLFSPHWGTEIHTPYGRIPYPSTSLRGLHPNQVWPAVHGFGYIGSGWLSIVSDNGLVVCVNAATTECVSTHAWSVKAGSLRATFVEFYTHQEEMGVVVGRNDERFVDVRLVRKGLVDEEVSDTGASETGGVTLKE